MLRNQRGTIIPFVIILLPVLLAMGAFVIDLSQAYSSQTRIKNAVDLASIAGISQLNGPASVSNAKNLILQYLNNNLTVTIPSFMALSLGSAGLTIQAGVYDFSSMSFTVDEANPSVNSLMVSYSYDSVFILAPIFMVTSSQLTGTATVAKQIAAKAQPGTGFPLVIYSTALDGADMNDYMITLYTGSNMDNSYWTTYTDSSPSTTDVNNVIDYFQTGMGTPPPGITVNDDFAVNDGNMAAVLMSLDPNILVGMTFLFALVTPTMDNEVIADGFLGGTINNIVNSMGEKYITITVTPGYIDNTYGGLQIGAGMTNVSQTNQSLLSNSYGLVQ